MIIEVCLESLTDAINAALYGADRLEVNSALALGGLTPSTGMVKLIHKNVRIPIIAMVRPRMSGFVYSDKEFETMLADAETLLDAGAAGLAVGFLTPEKYIDIDKIRYFRGSFSQCELVFHRAFDLLSNQSEAVDILADLGVNRILTSGGAETAIQGAEQLQNLIQYADDRIEILPAAGINADNVSKLIRETGCKQVHGTFSCLDELFSNINRTSINFNNTASVKNLLLNRVNINVMSDLVAEFKNSETGGKRNK